MKRFFAHIRSNVVAYIALFVALGGTSYAAVSVANHSLVPKNFNPKYIGGYVRAWAVVNDQGRVLSSSGGVRASLHHLNPPGFYVVSWGAQPTTNCTSTGSVNPGTSVVAPGYLITSSFRTKTQGTQSVVQTYNGQGQPTDLEFNAALLCASPR